MRYESRIESRSSTSRLTRYPSDHRDSGLPRRPFEARLLACSLSRSITRKRLPPSAVKSRWSCRKPRRDTATVVQCSSCSQVKLVDVAPCSSPGRLRALRASGREWCVLESLNAGVVTAVGGSADRTL
jgi:hypothetical protein